MEIMQAGLSWDIVLKRRVSMAAAFEGYDVHRIATFGEAKVERLMNDPGIIRHRSKVLAIIANAQVVRDLRVSYGGFADWLDKHHPMDTPAWVRLFRRTFRFTGCEIVGEFLMSLGWLPGAHAQDCPIAQRVADSKPPWIGI